MTLTDQDIEVAMERAKVYPAGIATTCWFWDEDPKEDELNGERAFERIQNEIKLECG